MPRISEFAGVASLEGNFRREVQPRGPEKFQWPRSNSSNIENYVNRGMTIIASPLLGFAGEPVMANQGVTIGSIEGNAGETSTTTDYAPPIGFQGLLGRIRPLHWDASRWEAANFGKTQLSDPCSFQRFES